MRCSSLVPITVDQFDVELSLYYSTPNNLTGKPIYSRASAFLHPEATKVLVRAIEQVRALNLKIVIWDAFRPLEGQQKLWEALPNERYVSSPTKGPRTHCRGVALDVTLRDMGNNALLVMGTDFDHMGIESHLGCTTISQEAQRNRLLLAGIMHTAGFVCYTYEWWHYQLPFHENYPVLSDVDASTQMIAK